MNCDKNRKKSKNAGLEGQNISRLNTTCRGSAPRGKIRA